MGVTDFKSEVRFDLQSCLEAAVALRVQKIIPTISLNSCRRYIRSGVWNLFAPSFCYSSLADSQTGAQTRDDQLQRS